MVAKKTYKVVPYNPKPHPMQYRIDEFRVLKSLVTGKRYE